LKKNNLLKGIFFTSFASIFWGIPQPLIFNQIKYIPAIEVVSHRALWSFIFLFLIITFIGRIKDLFLLFYSYKILLILSISAI
jgi:Predicted permeases